MNGIKRKFSSKNYAHIGFEIGLLIKGIGSLFEMLSGFLLFYFNPKRLSVFIVFVTRGELSEDPKDLIANALIRFSHSFSISAQIFGVIYLVSHGVIKGLLVLLLWRKKLWAYPLTIVSLIFFIGYQIYRFTLQSSTSLLVLTIFDMLMIILTFIEYRRVKSAKKE